MTVGELILGRPLRSDEHDAQRIGPLAGVPVLGLDALASSAYGPEAALTVLRPLGAMATGYIGPLTALIIALLSLVYLSYRQTIAAYPGGGGSYTVAKENLGPVPGLFAASALAVDYLLNVAVAIAAGVGALVSAVPALLPYTLPLCLAILGLITIINLRGVRDAGLAFTLPTYSFVACLGITIIAGVIKALLAHGHPLPVVPPPQPPAVSTTVSAWLLCHAFASGCTAMTGVEAVSNGVPVFRPPATQMAQRTLTVIIAVLIALVAGVALLARFYGITATHPGQPGYQSILSQMVAAVAGRGVFYYISLAAVLAVLSLSANTSFAGFPRLCSVLAGDGSLPAAFAQRGRRLVYSVGIIVLAILAGLLLIAFDGVTDRLVPLFAIGAFMAFTFSQLGMARHWRRRRGPGATRALVVNLVGAAGTGATLLIIAVSKFTEGAWLTVAIIPAIVVLLQRLQRSHDRATVLAEEVPLALNGLAAPLVVIPVRRLDRGTRQALRLAVTLGEDVQAVQVRAEHAREQDLARHWHELVERPAQQQGRRPPHLVVLESAYRHPTEPLLRYLQAIATAHPERPIAVVLPHFFERRWFRRHRAWRLARKLLDVAVPQVVVMGTP
ncbi:MAG TPA: APC family permease [Polyangia bacterium]|jgi:amino acid transporter